MGDTPGAAFVLTDRLLRSWIRCRRKAWLDRFGDSNQRLWTAHRTLQLDSQQKSFEALIPCKPGRGEEACKEGYLGVVGLRLKGEGPEGNKIEDHPPLLKRTVGESRWGQFIYQPVLARQGRKVTREHRLSLALTGGLLEIFQKAKVPEGLVISRTESSLKVDRVFLTKTLRKQLTESLERLSRDLKNNSPPPLPADRRKCTLCSWRGLCNAEAIDEGHLSEVSGVGARRIQILNQVGIFNLEDLANTDPTNLTKHLESFGSQHGAIAQVLIAQAKAQKDGLVERLDMNPSLPELKDAQGILLYDIESDPDARDDFLHGFLRISRKKNGQWDLGRAKYHPLLVMHEHGEERSWKRIKKLIDFYQGWPILHYGETESLTLYQMGKRQGDLDDEIENLQSRLINVHDRLAKHWRLPLNSYGLKTVASWLNFHWRKKGVDGAMALLWWRQWRGSNPKTRGNTNLLRRIMDYNQDDCQATWMVTQWLLEKDK